MCNKKDKHASKSAFYDTLYVNAYQKMHFSI